MITAIIVARGGSQRIPGKNRRAFHGHPILAYSIRAAQASGVFDRIVVSSDDPGTRIAARDYGAEGLERAPDMSEDSVGTQEVMAHVLEHDCPTATIACCIYPTAPLMSVEDLQQGFRVIKRLTPWRAFAMSVGTEPLHDPGQFYWGRRKSFIKRLPLIGIATTMIPVEAWRCCDINVEADWLEAERRYSEHILKK